MLPLPLRLLHGFHSGMERVHRGLDAVATGLALGCLDPAGLEEAIKTSYKMSSDYNAAEYNRSGLFGWERGAIDRFFQGREHLVVNGAGGGREVLALQKLGYRVSGFESEPQLAEYATALLEEEGFRPGVECVARNTWPSNNAVYQGAIVGWGLYMLVPERSTRVEMLRAAHGSLSPGSPLLVSFYWRKDPSLYFDALAKVANPLRRLRGQPPVVAGDSLEVDGDMVSVVHHFTRDEIYAELEEAGFEPALFSVQGFAHAVGHAKG